MHMPAANHKVIPITPLTSFAPSGGGGASDIDAELERFEADERLRLGLKTEPKQWHDPLPKNFSASQRAHTTILCGGLTAAHDRLIGAALCGLGYRVLPLDQPDNAALTLGKEFGNRGQCNPTYFTVGNLVKHLVALRDEQGLSTREIIENHLFVTAGACGPCRFGMYSTEYRKALRDAGFDGFRVLLFQQTGGLKQATGDEQGLALNASFFFKLLQAFMLGDAINLLGYRLRPYEVVPGATDAALERARTRIDAALRTRRGLSAALRASRRELDAIELDRSRVKPKVALIGEFWAMTTEGDGNYGLQRFLEREGAEVDIQPVSNWLLYLIWTARFQTGERQLLRGAASAPPSSNTSTRKLLAILWLARHATHLLFHWYARRLGLRGYHLADMKAIAEAARSHYHLDVLGGEGHMEVGKLILSAVKRKAALVLSVKPFGCMPSSGVSDGVQSFVSERYPQALFLPIETSGDGAVNVYSRVQMALFKARAAAQQEVAQAEADTGLTTAHANSAWLPWTRGALSAPAHSYRASTTAANWLYALARWRKRLWLRSPTAPASAQQSG